ncbi:MAG: XRE family transcriptional regulator [Pedobacter sp.]|nr:MAG: XRE family transcriptional regulator [Pedobacter sp.]
MNQFYFGENLRKIREEKSVSQIEMANLADISQTSYSRIEGKKTAPNNILIHKFAEILDVPATLLLPHVLIEKTNTGTTWEDKAGESLQHPLGWIVALALIIIITNTIFGMADSFFLGLKASEKTRYQIRMIVGAITAVYLFYWVIKTYKRYKSKRV